MAAPISWQTDTQSGVTSNVEAARSGITGLTFAFGANPNLALRAPAGSPNWLLIGGAAVALALLVWALKRKR
jgi:hypothetical protein